MLTLKAIIEDINKILDEERAWSDEELEAIFNRTNEEIELSFYRKVLVEHAAKIVLKHLKKKAKKVMGGK